ncbi:uncharacterized protein EV420DRAFT_1482667 [Desarmillaria tabescens]|uniref:Uncharacterized protein n=1 Tax=Armillaria tabescens TaxID=1929756 RepID=A0AA39JXB3_ARMTA|nr:uncharacterized protein EV420DRAFT_1482667 [Desarmillaria tabescens]KAK0450458.1 hypothetical protein EV420DRAFT_1482667 [Desarmillaria tabescens]
MWGKERAWIRKIYGGGIIGEITPGAGRSIHLPSPTFRQMGLDIVLLSSSACRSRNKIEYHVNLNMVDVGEHWLSAGPFDMSTKSAKHREDQGLRTRRWIVLDISCQILYESSSRISYFGSEADPESSRPSRVEKKNGKERLYDFNPLSSSFMTFGCIDIRSLGEMIPYGTSHQKIKFSGVLIERQGDSARPRVVVEAKLKDPVRANMIRHRYILVDHVSPAQALEVFLRRAYAAKSLEAVVHGL